MKLFTGQVFTGGLWIILLAFSVLSFEAPLSIEGHLLDHRGNILEGAEVIVTLSNEATGDVLQSSTTSGKFAFIVSGEFGDPVTLIALHGTVRGERGLELIGVMKDVDLILGEENASYTEPRVTQVSTPYQVTGRIVRNRNQKSSVDIINLRTNVSIPIPPEDEGFLTVISGNKNDPLQIVYEGQPVGSVFSINNTVRHISIDLTTGTTNLSETPVLPKPMNGGKDMLTWLFGSLVAAFLLLIGLSQIFMHLHKRKNSVKKKL